MSKPPIILIMADQLRWDCLSTYGKLPVPTPHLDTDPVKTRNRAADAPAETSGLRERLLRWGRSMPLHESPCPAPEPPFIRLSTDTHRP